MSTKVSNKDISMFTFMKVRAKAIKKTFRSKSYLVFQNLIGLNPPFIINGEIVSNPSFITLYRDNVREEYSNIENTKRLKRIISGEEPGNRNEAIVCLSLETPKGRRALAKAMVEPFTR
jgi:hypothetical protein